MPRLDINLADQIPIWPDLAALDAIGKMHHVTDAGRIAGIAGGMESGKPSVALAFMLPGDLGCVVFETSLALLLTAADVLKAKYGDPRE